MNTGEKLVLAVYAAGFACLLIAAALVSSVTLIAAVGGLFVFVAFIADGDDR